jgi:hypothetical protein
VTSERFTVKYYIRFESIHDPFKITTKERLEGSGGSKMYE